MKCKITNKKIEPFMSFGNMPIANGFVKKDDFKKEFFFKMEVGFSDELSLFQLNDHPKPESMFNDQYPFYTGSSEYMKNHFKKFSNFVKKDFLNTNSKIIEIGSNDGTLLKNFFENKENILGIEPSKNVAEKAISDGVPTLNEFFNVENVSKLKSFLGNTDAIFASNCICHIPDLTNLIKAVDLLLSKNGTFIFEEPYLGSMFEKTSYDQIYDEHIYMFSASSVDKIFRLYDFELIDVVPQVTHGGSLRYIIKRKNTSKKSDHLKQFLENEKKRKIDSMESCLNFKNNCELSKINIVKKLEKLKAEEKRICGYAATSKSTTVLNYCKIDNTVIDYICDTTPEKIGKYSPGMHIPIVDINHFRNNLPDAVYLFGWNHKDEIFKKEKDYKGEWFSHVNL
ncbi:class I SAM-dependent methyltransferase [Candidatus Pelagibacter sp.]|nr:class I SAM-dependent methyltransferase [Candidatus Pelagibacter sp.]